MRKGFTFIEMIFVILLIAILGSIATRRLMATRNDAKISVSQEFISEIIKEVADYGISQAYIDKNFSKMSNSAESMVSQGHADDSEDDKLYIKIDKVKDCLTMKIIRDQAGSDVNLTITKGDAGDDDLCKELQNSIDTSAYPIRLLGRAIKL